MAISWNPLDWLGRAQQPAVPPSAPGPNKGVLGYLRKWFGSWTGPGNASGTPADRELTTEFVNAAPPGVVIPNFQPHLDDTSQETPAIRLAYRLMLSQPEVSTALQGMILAVGALDLKMVPAKAKSRHDKEVAEFCEWNLQSRLKGGIPGLAWDILIGHLVDGYSISEKVIGQEHRGRWAGKWPLLAVKPKQVGDDVVLLTDQHRNVVGVRGLRYNAGQDWHPSRFVITSNNPMYGSATGTSGLRAAYQAWWLLDTATKLRAVAVEKRAVPFVYGEYTTSSEKASLEAALANVKSQNWAAVPATVKLQVLNIAGSADSVFASFCEDQKHRVYEAIAGASLQHLEGKKTNARGSAKVQRDTADLKVWSLAATLQQVFNARNGGLVPDLVDLNYAVEEYPKAVLGAVDAEEESKRFTMVQQAATQLPLSKQWVYDEFGLVPPDPNLPGDSFGGPPGSSPGAPALPGQPPGPPAQAPPPAGPGGDTDTGPPVPPAPPLGTPNPDEWTDPGLASPVAGKHLAASYAEAAWDEGKHPRADDGKFGSGSGEGKPGAKPGASTLADASPAIGAALQEVPSTGEQWEGLCAALRDLDGHADDLTERLEAECEEAGIDPRRIEHDSDGLLERAVLAVRGMAEAAKSGVSESEAAYVAWDKAGGKGDAAEDAADLAHSHASDAALAMEQAEEAMAAWEADKEAAEGDDAAQHSEERTTTPVDANAAIRRFSEMLRQGRISRTAFAHASAAAVRKGKAAAEAEAFAEASWEAFASSHKDGETWTTNGRKYKREGGKTIRIPGKGDDGEDAPAGPSQPSQPKPPATPKAPSPTAAPGVPKAAPEGKTAPAGTEAAKVAAGAKPAPAKAKPKEKKPAIDAATISAQVAGLIEGSHSDKESTLKGLAGLTVPQLKALAAQHGLAAKGTKQPLIDNLVAQALGRADMGRQERAAQDEGEREEAAKATKAAAAKAKPAEAKPADAAPAPSGPAAVTPADADALSHALETSGGTIGTLDLHDSIPASVRPRLSEALFKLWDDGAIQMSRNNDSSHFDAATLAKMPQEEGTVFTTVAVVDPGKVRASLAGLFGHPAPKAAPKAAPAAAKPAAAAPKVAAPATAAKPAAKPRAAKAPAPAPAASPAPDIADVYARAGTTATQEEVEAAAAHVRTLKGPALQAVAESLKMVGKPKAEDVAKRITNRFGMKRRVEIAGGSDPYIGTASPERKAEAERERQEAKRKLADSEARYKADPAAFDRKRAEDIASQPAAKDRTGLARDKPTRPMESPAHVEALYGGGEGATRTDIANAGKVLGGMAKPALVAMADRIGLKGMAGKKQAEIAEAIRMRIQNRIGAGLRSKMI
jgi:hypothetical protein